MRTTGRFASTEVDKRARSRGGAAESDGEHLGRGERGGVKAVSSTCAPEVDFEGRWPQTVGLTSFGD